MRIQYLPGLLFIVLTACSGQSDENAFQTQIDAIDKAEQVEDQMLQSAELQRKAIEESTE